jgi:hypothetical protein
VPGTLVSSGWFTAGNAGTSGKRSPFRFTISTEGADVADQSAATDTSRAMVMAAMARTTHQLRTEYRKLRPVDWNVPLRGDVCVSMVAVPVLVEQFIPAVPRPENSDNAPKGTSGCLVRCAERPRRDHGDAQIVGCWSHPSTVFQQLKVKSWLMRRMEIELMVGSSNEPSPSQSANTDHASSRVTSRLSRARS